MKKLEMLLPIPLVARLMTLIYSYNLPIQMHTGKFIREVSKDSKYKFIMQEVTLEYNLDNEIYLDAALVILDIA